MPRYVVVIFLFFTYFCLLCSHPSRSRYGSCPSVRLSVYLFVWNSNSKTKKHRKTKIGVDVFQADCHIRLLTMSTLGQRIFLFNINCEQFMLDLQTLCIS